MLNIAIAGAGPVGLTLARLLLPYTIHGQSSSSSADSHPTLKLTVFEKDLSPTSRRSLGGTLDLHPPTGLAAVRAMNLWSEFLVHARFEGEEMRMGDCNGMVYVHMTEQPQIKGFEARPEIDRVRLMEVLLKSVPEGMVKWGRGVNGVEEAGGETGQGKGKWNVRFLDGSVEGPFDLVVGADGAWSKVRGALTEVEPMYSGISAVSGTIDEDSAGSKEAWTRVSEMVGKGNNFNYSYGRSATAQRMGDGNIKSAFHIKRDIGWIEELKKKHENDDEALKKVLLEEFKEWVPEIQQWIRSSKDLWCMPLYELPVGHRYEHRKGLAVIGDAAHLMTPYAGEGVNAGMRDALDLSKAFEKVLAGSADLDSVVAEYEESMFTRAANFMAETTMNKNGMFAEDAPYSFFAAALDHVAKESVTGLSRAVLSWIPLWYITYSVFAVMGTYGTLRRRVRARKELAAA